MTNERLPTLGDRVKDQVSGFTGIVMAHVSYLHGCVRLAVAPEQLDSGKVIEERYFDQTQLELVDAGVFQPTILPYAPPTGGPPDRERGNFRR
jgi:hypothetical protein